MDLRLRFSFNHYRKRICRVKFLIKHFRIWIPEGGFHSNISRNGFAECEFQSSLGLGLDFEPGFASRVWTRPHNRPIRVYVSDPRPILHCTVYCALFCNVHSTVAPRPYWFTCVRSDPCMSVNMAVSILMWLKTNYWLTVRPEYQVATV